MADQNEKGGADQGAAPAAAPVALGSIAAPTIGAPVLPPAVFLGIVAPAQGATYTLAIIQRGNGAPVLARVTGDGSGADQKAARVAAFRPTIGEPQDADALKAAGVKVKPSARCADIAAAFAADLVAL